MFNSSSLISLTFSTGAKNLFFSLSVPSSSISIDRAVRRFRSLGSVSCLSNSAAFSLNLSPVRMIDNCPIQAVLKFRSLDLAPRKIISVTLGLCISNFFMARITELRTIVSSSFNACSTNIRAILGSLLVKVTRHCAAFLLTCGSSSSNDQPIKSHPDGPPFDAIFLRILEPLLLRSTSSSLINSSICKQPVSGHAILVNFSASKALFL